MPVLTSSQIAGLRASVEDTLFCMTCEIERFTETERDAYNQPSGAWAVVASDVPCYWWEDRESEVIGPNTNVLLSSQFLVVAAGTDIRTSDRLASVTGPDGTAMTGRLLVKEVRQHLADILCRVEAQVSD